MSSVGADPYCFNRPQFDFCEDFDTSDLPGVFEEQAVRDGVLQLTEEQASSPPRALFVSVNSGGEARLRHQFGRGGKLRLFGMLYVPELGSGDVEIAAFEVGEYRVAFGVSSDGTVWAMETDEALAADGEIPVGRWTSFRWDVNLYDEGTGTATLRFGSDSIVNVEGLSPPTSGDDLPNISIGLSSSTGEWAMHFDDLTVEVKTF